LAQVGSINALQFTASPKMKGKPGKKQARSKPSTPKKTSAPSNLIEELDDEDDHVYSGKKQTKRVRTEDEIIDKILKDNFPLWSFEQINLKVVDGVSLRDRIKADKVRQACNLLAMGKLYYASIRLTYQDDLSPLSQLTIEDKNQPSDETMMDALKSLLGYMRVTGPLEEWLELCDGINQKNIVALFRGLQRVSPHQSLKYAALVENVMSMVVGMDLDQQFDKEVKAMASVFDMALLKSLLSSAKANDQGVLDWWTNCKDYARLVLPVQAVETILALPAGGDVAKISAEVCEVFSGSETGKRLVGKAHRVLSAATVSDIVRLNVETLAGKNITAAAISTAKKAFVTKMKDEGHDITLTSRPHLKTVVYRDVAYKVPCTSIFDEWQCCKEALIRSVAVHAGLLESLWCEAQLVPTIKAPKVTVEPALIKHAKAARKEANKCVARGDSCTSENISAVLEKKQAWFGKQDKYWKVDEWFWKSSIGNNATSRWESSILACMPTSGGAASLDTTRNHLKTLLDSKLAEFVGTGLVIARD
jgi:hypothetical protein